MPLPAAEHARVQAETRRRRNAGQRHGRAALAYAHAWVAHFGARVEPLPTPTRMLYTVSLSPFHSQTAWRLVDAVDVLAGHVEDWCDSPATHGPTGGRLDRLRGLLEQWRRAAGGLQNK